MVTGIETAGLVLAAFPILIQCLDFYNGGVQKATELKNYRRVLKRLVRELKMEKCKFGNTCENLLDGMSSISAEEVKTLIEGEGWENTKFQDKLKKQLGSQSACAFTEAAKEMNSSLQELGEKIGLHEHNHEPMPVLNQLKIAFQQDYFNAVLARINKTNTDLAQITSQRVQTTSAAVQPRERDPPAAEHYNNIRTHARSLYRVFLKRFQVAPCSCSVPHNASLRLRRASMNKPDDRRLNVLFGSTNPTCTLEFDHEPVTCENKPSQIEEEEVACQNTSQAESLFVNLMENIKETVKTKKKKRARLRVSFCEPAASEQQTPPISAATTTIENLDIIRDLCTAIKLAAIGCSEAICIGVLDECDGLRHRIWQSKPWIPLSTYLQEIVSLEEILKAQCLEKKDRLRLGVQLASAVMQLHQSEWLCEIWGTKDIFFLQKQLKATNGQGFLVPMADKPFVRRMFPPQHVSSTSESYPLTNLIACDKSLFSLGIVLVELWFGECIENLQGSHSAAFDNSAAYETAQDKIGKIMREAGEAYGLAVSRCLGTMQGSLDDIAFKNKAHSEIVCLLEKNYEVLEFH
ncbi:hypothetical protein BDD12DRAFT_925468 [Trichophaea hybrida]|nr:hypothetical protein BDD12DRAFT_925468 [Trichophaea hybrida]